MKKKKKMKNLFNRDNNLLFFALIIISVVAFLFFLQNDKLNKIAEKKEAEFLTLQNTFAESEITAKAFAVFDLTDYKEIYSKNGDEILPIASLTKTMSVLIALKENSKDKIITISSEALAQKDYYGFSLGEKFKMEDLIPITLAGSINDSSYALVENIPNILEKMNDRAKRFGMNETYFLNTTGLDLEKENMPVEAGVFGSARNMNTLAMYANLMYPEIFKEATAPEIKITSNLGKIYTIKNTNEIVDKIPNLLFSKTGYTDIAGGNLSIIFINPNEHKIAISLLNSTKKDRFFDMEKLVNLSYNIGIGE